MRMHMHSRMQSFISTCQSNIQAVYLSFRNSLSRRMPFRGYWDEVEEDSLRAAVQKHGVGAWERSATIHCFAHSSAPLESFPLALYVATKIWTLGFMCARVLRSRSWISVESLNHLSLIDKCSLARLFEKPISPIQCRMRSQMQLQPIIIMG